MIAPPTTIDGKRYMDAGVLSGTNAQLAAGYDLVVVLAVARPGQAGILSNELEGLRASGSRVETITPDAPSSAAIFPNMLDLTKRAAAAEAGRAQGLSLATAVKSWKV
jgi:NTE family protein